MNAKNDFYENGNGKMMKNGDGQLGMLNSVVKEC